MHPKWNHLLIKDGQPGLLFTLMGLAYPLIGLIFLFLSFLPKYQEDLSPLKATGLSVACFSMGAALMLWKLSNPYARWWMIHDHLWAAEADDPQSRKPIRKNFRIMAWILFIFALIFNTICYTLSDLGYSL